MIRYLFSASGPEPAQRRRYLENLFNEDEREIVAARSVARNRKMKRRSLIPMIVAAVVFVLSSGCSTNRTDVRRSLDQTVRSADSSPKVIADYQPWFGDKQHINVGYSTQDPSVLRKQIQQAKDLGIYAFAVDWYGERRPFLDRSYDLLQQVAAQNQFHVGLMYDETEEDNGHATDDALEALDKAYRAYIATSAPSFQNAGTPIGAACGSR
ncbi:MAG: hypothetical protein DMG84_07960 [Acidobacteria bacterium]|nr:MAG: hypothetical protein DMG84_07960 [Acidobacteriota bacterium]